MDDGDVLRQIQQMVAFIKQEALERAQEISVSSEEEFEILKQQIVEQEQRKIRQEFERKEKLMDTRKKIEYSMQLNNSRLKVLQAQDDLVMDIKKAAQKQIYSFSANHSAYKHLINDLIVQGLMKLREPSLILRCRHADFGLVKSVIQPARDRFAAKMKAHPPEVVIDEDMFLPASDDQSNPGRTCAGGVVLTSRDGRIICDNTLDSRLEVTFKQLLPEIRRSFFASDAPVNYQRANSSKDYQRANSSKLGAMDYQRANSSRDYQRANSSKLKSMDYQRANSSKLAF